MPSPMHSRTKFSLYCESSHHLPLNFPYPVHCSCVSSKTFLLASLKNFSQQLAEEKKVFAIDFSRFSVFSQEHWFMASSSDTSIRDAKLIYSPVPMWKRKIFHESAISVERGL